MTFIGTISAIQDSLELGVTEIDGFCYDLGSPQLDERGAWIFFKQDAPDMRIEFGTFDGF